MNGSCKESELLSPKQMGLWLKQKTMCYCFLNILNWKKKKKMFLNVFNNFTVFCWDTLIVNLILERHIKSEGESKRLSKITFLTLSTGKGLLSSGDSITIPPKAQRVTTCQTWLFNGDYYYSTCILCSIPPLWNLGLRF